MDADDSREEMTEASGDKTVEGSVEAARGVRFACKECAANLEYAPGTTQLVCQYCGTANEILEREEEVEETDFRSAVAALEERAEGEEQRVMKCGACAAEMEARGNVTAQDCPYCGFHLNITLETRKHVKPSAMLPFTLKAEEARGAFSSWLGKLWFAPSKLKGYARSETKLTGMYVPYWTYDAKATCPYEGTRGDDYWETVGFGKNARRVRRTRWTNVSGTVHRDFNDVLVLASKTLPAGMAEKLAPWGLPELVPYTAEYVAGFTCESYQVGLAEGFGGAERIMEGRLREQICAEIGGDHQKIESMQASYREITYKHVLLPMWISAYRYHEKVYRFLVNARTGEVQGERPWSWWKIGLTVAGAALGAAAVIWMLMRM